MCDGAAVTGVEELPSVSAGVKINGLYQMLSEEKHKQNRINSDLARRSLTANGHLKHFTSVTLWGPRVVSSQGPHYKDSATADYSWDGVGFEPATSQFYIPQSQTALK